VKRWLVLACVMAMAAAAPARAWCEATCLAAAETSESHCRTHDPADGTTAIGADEADACPVLESARPTVPARLDVNTAPIKTGLAAAISRIRFAPSFVRADSTSTVFERCIPLRI
jgi:hypothetical protein